MTKNIEKNEQIIRSVLGAILIIMALIIAGILGFVIGIIGIGLLVTSFVSY